MYYIQYEKKDEIEEIFHYDLAEEIKSEEEPAIVSNTLQEEMIDEFIDRNFKDILTDRAKEILFSNRLIPNKDVLDSDKVKATIVDIEFSEGEEEGELLFTITIDYEEEDGNKSTSMEKGWIKIMEDEGTLKVDGFKID